MLWFGGHVGQNTTEEKSPTYVYPEDIRSAIRKRFPDSEAGSHDKEYELRDDVHHITWEELKETKWPNPPKKCRLCPVKSGCPY